MNRFLWFNRRLMAWGNPSQLDELMFLDWKKIGFWKSLGW